MMKKDIQLSEHFKLSEFTRSATAQVRGIDNMPGQLEIENLRALCREVLEPLRAYAQQYGQGATEVPIRISSGYRCRLLNAAVGGVKNSQHMKGEACDIAIPDIATGEAWYVWLMDHCRFDQLIKERNRQDSKGFWIHVSYSRKHNRQTCINGLVKHR